MKKTKKRKVVHKKESTNMITTSYRISSKHLDLLEQIAKHQLCEKSDMIRYLIALLIEYYDELFDIATSKGITVMRLIDLLVKEFIHRNNKTIKAEY